MDSRQCRQLAGGLDFFDRGNPRSLPPVQIRTPENNFPQPLLESNQGMGCNR
jgi:hypothetical protein